MSPTIEKQLEEIEQLIVHGKYKEGLKAIAEGLKNKKISKKDELSFLVFRSEIMLCLGDLEEALKLADHVLEESEGLDNLLVQIDAFVQKAHSTYISGRPIEGIQITDKGLELASTAKHLPAKEIAERKARLLDIKACAIQTQGDNEKCMIYLFEAEPLAKESGNKRTISFVFANLGVFHFITGKPEKGEEYLEKALSIATELNNKFLMSQSYLYKGFLKRLKREYTEAIPLFKKAFSLSKEIGSTFTLSYQTELGRLYISTFELDKALDCLFDSLNYNVMLKHYAFAYIGLVYLYKYDLEKAQEYFLKSKEICESIKQYNLLPFVLYNLILINLELKNLNNAQKLLNQLKQISTETGFKDINQMYQLASIIVLKARGDISELGKAVKLIDEFLADKDLPLDRRLEALYSMLEIKIKELQFSPNEETLREVQKHLHHLEVVAEEQPLLWLLANVYRLQSRLALIQLDAQRAFELLDKAQTIADEIKVVLLKKKIEEDKEKINQQLDMWNKLQEQKASINETIKLVSLESTIKNIKKDTVIEERDKESGNVIEYRKLFTIKL